MQKVISIFVRLVPRIILVTFSLLLFLLSIGSLLFSSFSDSNSFFRSINPLNVFAVILIAICILAYVYLGQKLLEKYKVAIKHIQKWSLIITAAILVVVLLIYSQVPIVSDQEGLFVWPFYYTYWDQFDYMIPMGVFCSLLVKLFGSNGALFAFRLVNLLLMMLAFWSLGKITEKLFSNKKITTIYYLIAPLCLQFIFYISWAYGNIPSVCLMIFTMYMLMKFFDENKWCYIAYILPVTFIALAFKLQAQVIIIAIIIVLILRLFQIKNRQKTVVLGAGLLVVLLFTIPFFRFVANAMQDEYEIGGYVSLINVAQGIAAYDDQDKIAYQKFSDENNLNLTPVSELIGQWSPIIDAHTMTALRNDEFAKLRSIERINYRLNEFRENPEMAARFFLRKSLIGWASPDFSALSVWGASDYYHGRTGTTLYINDPNKPKLFTTLQPGHKGYDIALNFSDGYETLIYLTGFIGILFVFRNKKSGQDLFILIIPLIFTGQFILSQFTESGGRFNFYVFVLLLLFSPVGLFCISQKITKLLQKRKRKKEALV